MLKNVILSDCEREELDDFVRGLEEAKPFKWEIEVKISNWGKSNSYLEIKRYLIYFVYTLKLFINRNKYKRVLAWQQFYGIGICFYCMLFRVKKYPSIYILNYTYKEKNGFIGILYYIFMRKIINSKYIKKVFVPSKEYINYCSKTLMVKKDIFEVVPFGIPDLYNKYKGSYKKDSDYVLSIGRSNRDYDWLINEWKNINIPLYIICDTYNYNGILPSNIKIINNVSGKQQYPYILNAKMIILAIKDGKVCSGDTVLLTSMSLKKIVIVTAPSTLSEMYIKNGVNGYVVSKEKGKMKILVESIKKMESVEIENNARKSYLKNFSRFIMGKNIGNIINF